MKLTFLGAAGTVTGSKYLVESGSRRILVDCGLFQGRKRLRERNWRPFSPDPATLDAVVLTHAHLDHSGYLPVIARSGFRGPVYCTAATCDLLGILLPDSAWLQEEEAEFANRHGFSKHSPALPLYTQADAQRALQLLRPVAWSTRVSPVPDLELEFSPAGHLLGAASVLVQTVSRRILFSGDLGRSDDPVMRPPAPPPVAESVVIESTYGDRRHPPVDPESELAALMNPVLQRGGVIVVPSFAVGRAQALVHLITRLKARRAIADVPVFLNSPMATEAMHVHERHLSEHRLTAAECEAMRGAVRFVNSVDESKGLNRLDGPAILVSASGMATGGRVIHHLKAFAPGERNLILFAGFQVPGTRGAAMLAGADAVRIHGEWIPVRAAVAQLQGLSAHADCDQLVAWLKSAALPSAQVYVTHGEPAAAESLALQIRRELGLQVTVPADGGSLRLESHHGS
jgi:metallo-beta-lactamase family protein